MKMNTYIASATLLLGFLLTVNWMDVAYSAELNSGAQKAPSKSSAKNPNRFNRLFKGPSNFNLPQVKDGFHDPDSVGSEVLQPPKVAFETLPKSRSGNRVDWVKALNEGFIEPRSDLTDENKKMTVLNLDIVREVKGSMPDVVYPHKQHTEWLQCSNCHSKIFIPKKGANKISMAAILAGQYCGVCHGKVAFPISECRLCHSKKKTKEEVAGRSHKGSGSDSKVAGATAKSENSKLPDMNRAALFKLGATVYEDTCAGCHGENGEGVPGTFPALAGSKIATGSVDEHINIVLNGKDDTAMQPWRNDLKPEEIAAVISFERGSWGNSGGMVQPSTIQEMLKASASASSSEPPPIKKPAAVQGVTQSPLAQR